MLVGQLEPKRSFYRNSMTILVVCIFLISLGRAAFQMMTPTLDARMLSSTAVPMLINSGIVQSKEAEVKVVLWFEQGDIPLEIWAKRPMPDWVWYSKSLQTESGKVAVTLSGSHIVNKNEETNLYTWYTTMAQQLAKVGGKIYIDERVPQAIDISAYLSQINALPAQWSLLGNTVSIAAYHSNLKTKVWAGQDRINIQLLCRGKNNEGQTVLAMPALLEEF
ncbi:hypothetical protein [Desulfosporosinus metallidurans]|uniref:Uncharacterized protein n=1 Tax=Desulfosporosinus metallidurans TaxID=1888891 RepID=A0A1Q8R2N8_9FIRM|nr:hypothetical protein [Desulfosporosinus metallidurans]OLN33933.1 hypothetical protein DSOL_0111 [Desulfosporosinus metallidurans]